MSRVGHCLVTGGGLSSDGATWHPAGKSFLFPKSMRATLVRAREGHANSESLASGANIIIKPVCLKAQPQGALQSLTQVAAAAKTGQLG